MNRYHFNFQKGCDSEWTLEHIPSFNEMILSWNGHRPPDYWTFKVKVFQDRWSSWITYAEWGEKRQKTFHGAAEFVDHFQDIISIKNGVCSAFKVKIEGKNLDLLNSLTASLSSGIPAEKQFEKQPNIILKNLAPQSQLILEHHRHRDFCSPTSLSIALNIIYKSPLFHPMQVAEKVRDQTFDIYGNWVLNTAEVFNSTKGKVKACAVRLNGFHEIYQELARGLPVVVSVKGSLSGAYLPYEQGHLICIVGYEGTQVVCIDPAYPTSAKTVVRYTLKEFLAAWQRRGNLAYLFSMNSMSPF